MIVVYKRLSKAEIRSSAKEAIVNIEEWFKANPKRRICRTQGWYGKMIRVRKGHVAEDINAAAMAAMA